MNDYFTLKLRVSKASNFFNLGGGESHFIGWEVGWIYLKSCMSIFRLQSWNSFCLKRPSPYIRNLSPTFLSVITPWWLCMQSLGSRVAIKHAFGWWKRRCHLLHSEVRMNPEKTCQLIGARAVLHNIVLLRNEPIGGLLQNEDHPDIAPYHGPENGKPVRDYICNTFF